jgi:hypothetical protein
MSTEPGTTESIVFWPGAESRPYWIIFNVLDSFLVVLSISDVAIEIVRHPELPTSA